MTDPSHVFIHPCPGDRCVMVHDASGKLVSVQCESRRGASIVDPERFKAACEEREILAPMPPFVALIGGMVIGASLMAMLIGTLLVVGSWL